MFCSGVANGVNLINLWLDVFHLTHVLYDYYMTLIVQQGNTTPIYACVSPVVMIMRTVIVVRISEGNTDPRCMDRLLRSSVLMPCHSKFP